MIALLHKERKGRIEDAGLPVCSPLRGSTTVAPICNQTFAAIFDQKGNLSLVGWTVIELGIANAKPHSLGDIYKARSNNILHRMLHSRREGAWRHKFRT